MKITVLGATGGTGIQVVRQALQAGHAVTALVRRPAALAVEDESLRKVKANLDDVATMRSAISGSDAVVSTLGASKARTPTTVYSEGTCSILRCMQDAGVSRLVTVSAAPAGPDSDKTLFMRWWVDPVLFCFFGMAYADMRRMEAELERSDGAWTVVRPPRLTDHPATGRYRVAVDSPLPRAYSISRADLAAAILAAVPDTRLHRRALSVSN